MSLELLRLELEQMHRLALPRSSARAAAHLIAKLATRVGIGIVQWDVIAQRHAYQLAQVRSVLRPEACRRNRGLCEDRSRNHHILDERFRCRSSNIGCSLRIEARHQQVPLQPKHFH